MASNSAKNVFRTAEEELTKTFLMGALQNLDQLQRLPVNQGFLLHRHAST